MIGQTISHYKILDKVGEGGMGIVYKAHDTKLDRTVALKFLPHYLGSDLSEKERFFHEARAASTLNHPHITTIYEIDESEGQYFIAMEYVEGKTLKQLIESETPSLKKVLDIAIQTCDGLAAAHEKGVIHRDIKSDNIMVTPKGQAKIMDFGLAKLRGATKLTKEGSTIGTAAYMSPEQASGEEIDQRSDIFSFGVVLYELLSRNLPFRGEHHAAILYSITNEEPQPVARFNNKVSPELERIVSKVLAKDRDERYQHIDDLLADLRRERKNLEYVKAPTIARPVEVPKPRKRIAPLIIAVSALSLLVVLLFVFDPFQLKVSREETAEAAQNSLAVMYFENIPDPEDKDNTGEMLTNLLITALSQVEGLDVISRERLYDIQNELGQVDSRRISPSLATELAQRAGVKTMLLGSILQERPMLAVTSRLIEVRSGKIVSSHRLTEFSGDQMFSLVDSLAIMVKNDLNIQEALAPEAKSVAEVTSKSLEAYRSYVEGVELVKKFYHPEGRAALERAIELDSDFAMAYFRLSIVNRFLGDNAGHRKALQRAWELSNNVPEKERLQIQATYIRRIENNPLKASEILEKLLQKYPHEQSAYSDLANAYTGLGNYEKAIQTYLTGLRYDPLDKSLWNDLAYRYAGLNRRKEALEAVDKYLSLAPGEPNPYDSKGEIYSAFGEVDSARYWFRKAISLRPDFLTNVSLGFIAILRQDYVRAEDHFQRFGTTSDKFQKALAETFLSLIPMHRGQLSLAQEQMLSNLTYHQNQKLQGDIIDFDYLEMALIAYERADYSGMLKYAKARTEELKKDPSNLMYGRDLLAWALLKSGNPKKSSKIMNQLETDIRGKSPLLQVRYDYTSALLAYEEGNYGDAVEKFQKAFQHLFPNHAPQFHYAVSLLKTGRVSDAIEELQRVTWWSTISFPPISLFFLPTTAYWPIAAVKAHYWLGVAYEQQDEKNKAIKEYEKFLDLWKDADTDLSELQDAKARLAKLKGTAVK